MDWDDVRFFLAVAREGTLAGAAKQLRVNHTTVSRRLHGMEERLGVRLFERLPHGWRTTEAGAGILAAAERMEGEFLEIDRRVSGQDTRLSGTLRVTTYDALFCLLAEDIASFSREYPEIELQIVTESEFLNLSRREADVAIRATNSPPEHLVGRRVGRFEFAVYAARSLVEAAHGSRDLNDYPWLGWDSNLGARMTEQYITEHAPRARRVARMSAAIPMIEAVRAGIGVMAIPCIHGEAEPQLERLTDVIDNFGMDLWVLSHEDLRHTARVRRFVDHMSNAFEHKQEALGGHSTAA